MKTVSIYVQELFEGDTIREDILKDNLELHIAKEQLSLYHEAELKKWHKGMFEDNCSIGTKDTERGFYYIYAIPVGHDRCLRVGIKGG